MSSPATAHQRAFEDVRELLGLIFTTAEGESLETVAGFDLSFTQARMIFIVASHEEPVAISDIAERLGLSVASTGRNVDQLVTKELLTRTENPDDRRVKLVELSARGRTLAEEHLRSKEDAVRRLLGRLDIRQCHALTSALAPLIHKS